MSLDELKEFLRRGQAAQTAVDRLTGRKPKACDLCQDEGKLDRGNGTTKPCACAAGAAERERRKVQRGKR